MLVKELGLPPLVWARFGRQLEFVIGASSQPVDAAVDLDADSVVEPLRSGSKELTFEAGGKVNDQLSFALPPPGSVQFPGDGEGSFPSLGIPAAASDRDLIWLEHGPLRWQNGVCPGYVRPAGSSIH